MRLLNRLCSGCLVLDFGGFRHSSEKGMPYFSANQVFSYGTEDGRSIRDVTGYRRNQFWVRSLVAISYSLFNRRDVTSG